MIKAENVSLRISLKYRKKNASFVRIVVTKYGNYDPFLESVKRNFFHHLHINHSPFGESRQFAVVWTC